MEIFLVIIVTIFGVLQIILFFKIWGMTNNVKKLTEHFVDSLNHTDIGNKVRFAKLQGQTQEQIQKILSDNMATFIIETYNKPNYSVEYTVKKWEEVFNNAGIEMPNYLKQIKTYQDVINLYHEKE